MLKRVSGTSLWAAVLCFAGSLAAAQAEMVYNRGNIGDFNTLDPHKMSTVQEATVMRDVFEGLVTYDIKGNAIPGAAESWTITPDSLVYTFKLRANGKWSNGDPVKASDFVFGLRHQEDPKTASKYAAILYTIKNAEEANTGKAPLESMGVKALDDLTLEITLKTPTPYFIELLTHHAAYPLHQKSVEQYGADWVKPGKLISNGAFKVTEFAPKDKLKIVKNEHFHDAANVKLDTVITYPLEDRNAGLKRFEAGEIDTYNEIPAEQMSYIKTKFKDELQMGPYLGMYYFSIKTDKGAPFNDPRLRRALALVIDRDYLVDKIWNGTMYPAYGIVPPGIKGYTGSEYDFKAMSQLDREEEAKKIMTELGYGPGKPLKLEIRYNTGEDHKNTCVALATMFKAIGVETTLLNTDGKTHYDYLQSRTNNYDLARAAWIADYKDPESFLSLSQGNNGNNYARYKNAVTDDFLEKAAAERDAAKRMDYLAKAEEQILKDSPMIPVMFYTYKDLVSKNIKGFEPNVLDVHLSRYISKTN